MLPLPGLSLFSRNGPIWFPCPLLAHSSPASRVVCLLATLPSATVFLRDSLGTGEVRGRPGVKRRTSQETSLAI